MHERDGDRGGRLQQTRRECLDREKWIFFFVVAIPLGKFPEVMRHHKL